MKTFLAAILSCAAAVGVTMTACGDDSSTRPTVACSDSTTTSTEPGPASATVVVAAAGTHCGDSPLEVVVIREPSEPGTMGQQIRRNRYAVIGTVQPGAFDIRIPIGSVVRPLDGTELRKSVV